MAKIMDINSLLEKVREKKTIIHNLTSKKIKEMEKIEAVEAV